MQLSAWPVPKDSIPHWTYDGGDPDAYLWSGYVLDGIEPLFIAKDTNAHIAEDIRDPFVFAQFLAVFGGHVAMNGTPFYSNWRLAPSVQRMAARLGADQLADKITQIDTLMRNFPEEILDGFDRHAFANSPEHADLDARFWKLFHEDLAPIVAASTCQYGTHPRPEAGVPALFAGLAEWVSDTLPRQEVADEAQKVAMLNAVYDAMPISSARFQKFVAQQIGSDTAALLARLGLRYRKTRNEFLGRAKGSRLAVARVEMADGKVYGVMWFDEDKLLFDLDTVQELGRVKRADRVRNTPDAKPITLSKQPKLAFDKETNAVRPVGFLSFRVPGKILRYRSED